MVKLFCRFARSGHIGPPSQCLKYSRSQFLRARPTPLADARGSIWSPDRTAANLTKFGQIAFAESPTAGTSVPSLDAVTIVDSLTWRKRYRQNGALVTGVTMRNRPLGDNYGNRSRSVASESARTSAVSSALLTCRGVCKGRDDLRPASALYQSLSGGGGQRESLTGRR